MHLDFVCFFQILYSNFSLLLFTWYTSKKYPERKLTFNPKTFMKNNGSIHIIV